MKTYVNELKKLSSPKLKAFNEKLIPSTKYEILGVDIPSIRDLAKTIGLDKEFINTLPHTYHEENILHALIITYAKLDISELISNIKAFLPYVDNWAVSDSMLKPANKFNKYQEELLLFGEELVKERETYHIRFGLLLFLSYALKKADITKYINLSLEITNHDYYVEMMQAWFYATALINHQDDILVLLEKNKLTTFVHNKTIQKAVESYRISEELKQQLRKLKRV